MPEDADGIAKAADQKRALRLIERGLCGVAAFAVVHAPDLDPGRPAWGVAFELQAVYELEGPDAADAAASRWTDARVDAQNA